MILLHQTYDSKSIIWHGFLLDTMRKSITLVAQFVAIGYLAMWQATFITTHLGDTTMKDSLNFLPTLLLALALVLAWRFLLGIAALALSILLWVLLFTFCKGIAQGFRETTENGGAA